MLTSNLTVQLAARRPAAACEADLSSTALGQMILTDVADSRFELTQ